MRKSGGVVILMNYKKIEVLAGEFDWKEKGGTGVFQEEMFSFFHDLAVEIRENQETAGNREAQAFAFWLRKQHICQCPVWREKKKRMGMGMIFHIAPSNIPMLFAYSMAFGMMAGNGNIIRVSPKIKRQIEPFCRVLHQVMCRKKYQNISKRNIVMTYDRNESLTQEISFLCDGRVIWGGDKTIKLFEQMPMYPGSVTLTFPDRSSIALFDVSWMMAQEEEGLRQMAYGFYKDTLQMDQNACSSPKVIFWIGEETAAMEEMKKRWWNMFYQISRSYDLDQWKSSEKYLQMIHEIMDANGIKSVKTYENYLYTVQLEDYPVHPEQYQGKFGCFYEYSIKEAKDVCGCLSRKIQTIVYAGVDSEKLADEIIKSGKKGGDRIVPVGMALELDFIWDGKDVVSQLSRVIDAK